MLFSTDAASLRDALRNANFTVDAVHQLLGADAHRALMRNETTPARKATGGGSPLETLTRLFSLQVPVSYTDAERALPGLVDAMSAAEMIGSSIDEVNAKVDIRPYGDEDHDWWIVCDLTPGLDGLGRSVDSEHVLGISEASTSLAQLTLRGPVASALDLGTGCGVQSLHLASHVNQIVATDVNPRALRMARLTSELNEVEFEVRDGSLFKPVAAQKFDLIVTNPPFVVSPATDRRLIYRDSGLPGDEVVRRVVADAPAHLNDDGWCQVLANWVHREDESWQERISGWLEPTGVDAWVLQREVADLSTYVEMWLADAGLQGAPDYVERYDRWLSWFDAQGIEAIGFGWLSLHKAGRDNPVLRIEEWRGEVEQPVGPHVAAWADRMNRLRGASGASLLSMRLRTADGAVQHTVGPVGADDPAQISIKLQRGIRRERVLDTVEAGLLGACDGELAAGQILDALASLLDLDPARTRSTYIPRIRDMIADGYLEVAP